MAVALGPPSRHAQALTDLRDDFEELGFLCDGAGLQTGHPLRRELDATPTAAGRDRVAAQLRREYALRAALSAADEWQSPAIGAGIRAHIDDYKRDRHAGASAYEHAYAREFVGARDVRAFSTSCGMAALTTILAFLRADAPVLLGRASYHETKDLVTRRFGDRAIEVDDADLPDAISALDPAALFVDSLCNSRGLVVPPLDRILSLARGWVVVDNTCLGPACRPFDSSAPKLLVWESLLKLAQFGLDRANAGILLARGPGVNELDTLRERLGTNVPDTAIGSLPPPDRQRLARRLARLERNAAILTERLGGFHPGSGPILQLDVADPEGWIERALGEARARGVQVVHGTSFGFDHTRVYLTAPGPDSFLRIAPGTEDRLRIESVAEALSAAS